MYGTDHNNDTADWCAEHAVERYMCGCPAVAADADHLRGRLTDGGAFVLDTPRNPPTIWGRGSEILWAQGEALTLAGPPGTGKTTVTGQLVRALLGLSDEVLGFPVTPARSKVLYLAMDRPRQIARALRRHFHEDEREVLSERLTIWQGPPPADLARNTELLARLAAAADASHVILDSLKDAALGLTEDEVGAGYNRARQCAIAAGVDIAELHHVTKRGANGATPDTLADLYGSAWLTAGTGSVVLLWGEAGDPVVTLKHLKPVAEPVGPLKVIHDHEAGVSTVNTATDPLTALKASRDGLTAQTLAALMFEAKNPTPAQVEKARRKLEALVRDRTAEKIEGQPRPDGGKAPSLYRAAPSNHGSNHGP